MFVRSELQRVSEFFEGDMQLTGRFILETWAPDARRTLAELASVVEFHDDRRSAFLCDHLREGARTVGASMMIDLANSIEFHVANGNHKAAGERIWDALISLRRARKSIPQLLFKAAKR